MIDLRSDTTTLPSDPLRKAFASAHVGDDAYGEDKSVKELTQYCRDLFGVEDALFTTSGMLSNRLAVLSQTSRGDEVITDYSYHINFFDSAAFASVCQVVLNTCYSKDGILRGDQIAQAINSKPRYYIFAQPKLVSIENTINGWIGKVFPFEDLKKLRIFTEQNGLSLHMDGARLFNAHIKTDIPLSDYAQQVDTLSVCFAKGLGAPFGSMLMGKKDIIHEARKHKAWLGSGFHQVGFNAAAALYALKNNLSRLQEDHEKAEALTALLKNIEEIDLHPNSGETNMIQFKLRDSINPEIFMESTNTQGLLLFPWLPSIFRAVVHLNITSKDIVKTPEIIKKAIKEAKRHD